MCVWVCVRARLCMCVCVCACMHACVCVLSIFKWGLGVSVLLNNLAGSSENLPFSAGLYFFLTKWVGIYYPYRPDLVFCPCDYDQWPALHPHLKDSPLTFISQPDQTLEKAKLKVQRKKKKKKKKCWVLTVLSSRYIVFERKSIPMVAWKEKFQWNHSCC